MAAVVAGVAGETPSAPWDIPSGNDPAPASVDVTVVDETCREPDDLRPLEEPATKKHHHKNLIPCKKNKNHLPVELGECCEPLDADRGAALPGGLPPVDRGLPGGRLSATDIRAAIGLWPEPGAAPDCWPPATGPEVEPVAPLPSGGEPVLLLANGDVEELEPLALATERGASGLS